MVEFASEKELLHNPKIIYNFDNELTGFVAYSAVISEHLDRDYQSSGHMSIISKINDHKDSAYNIFSEGLFLIRFFRVEHQTVLFTYQGGY